MNSQGYCRSCASRKGQLKRPEIQRIRSAKNASGVAKVVNHQTFTEYLKSLHQELTPEIWRKVIRRASGAKSRCTNTKSVAYKDYGGRGIRFNFDTPKEMAEWIIQNLGSPPTPRHQIDRIDNDSHYEAGNLRWADFFTQANNKRDYRGWRYGKRMKKLREARPDYTIEGLRKFILWGWSDNEIIEHKKGSHIRHRKLRAKA